MRTREAIQKDIEDAKSARESMRRVAEDSGWNEANAGFVNRCNDRIQALSKELEDLDKPAPPPQAETPTRFHRVPVI